jgi:Flp pilus assembly protein TadB
VTGPAVLAALLAGVAVCLVVPRSAPRLSGHHRQHHLSGVGQDALDRFRAVIAVGAGGLPVLVLGGVVGAAAGAVVVAVVWRVLGSRETARERRRREEVARALPHVVDLIAVALAGGASPAAATVSVAAAVDGAVREELLSVHRSLAVGVDPARVWRELARRPGMGPLGRTMTRAVEAGSSVSVALHRLAEDLHRTARADAESRARAVGVKAAVPLGLCLLPAFVLVGVVPLVGSTLTVLMAP